MIEGQDIRSIGKATTWHDASNVRIIVLNTVDTLSDLPTKIFEWKTQRRIFKALHILQCTMEEKRKECCQRNGPQGHR